jgi:spectinomycin phosphotransferase
MPLSDSIITDCLNASYGIQVLSLTPLPLGADVNASVYKAQTLDQSYFIKLKRGHHQDIGVQITELLEHVGVKQIIPPMRTIRGKAVQPIGDFTLIVYPFINGQNGFSHALTEDQWIELGKALRQLHTLKVPPFIQQKIRQESYSPKWRQAVRSIYTHLERTLSSDEIALKLQNFIKKKVKEIRQLVDCAEQLGEKLKHNPPKCVLCHSDIHAGNVLVDTTNALYLVDWDEPIMAPKERDLMFIGGGVGSVWNKPHEQQLFYQGYGKTEINSTALAYYRHERIVEDIAIYSRELLLKTGSVKDRLEMYGQLTDQFEPQGVVEIAFQTMI